MIYLTVTTTCLYTRTTFVWSIEWSLWTGTTVHHDHSICTDLKSSDKKKRKDQFEGLGIVQINIQVNSTQFGIV